MTDDTPATPALWAAVLEAQRAIREVTKDKTAKVQTKAGPGYEYKFASTEDMMAAAREALLAHGVFAQRLGFEIRDGAAGAEVLSTFRLVHPESSQIEVYPPVPMPISGTGAADKVLAGALTYSWSYWLRDVLAIPRGDAHDPDRRATDDGASRFGQKARPEPQRSGERKAPRPEPEPDHLWMAYKAAQAAAAKHMRATDAQAHQRLLALAEVEDDPDMPDDDVRRLIEVAEAVLLTDPAPSTSKPASAKAEPAPKAEPTSTKVTTAKPKTTPSAKASAEPAEPRDVQAARKATDSAYRAYQDTCKEEGVAERPWMDIAYHAIGKAWDIKQGSHGVEDYERLAAAYEDEIDRVRKGEGAK